MTLIVIRDKNPRLEDARVVANVLCALGLVDQLPGCMPFREAEHYGGSLEVSCVTSEILKVKAAFVAAGFSALETK